MPFISALRPAVLAASVPCLLLFGACSTPPTAASIPLRNLSSGEHVEIVVAARAPATTSGVFLERGATYSVHVAPADRWMDFYVCTDANGFTSTLLAPLALKKPLPDAPWFILTGRIGDGPAFAIGTNWTGNVEAGGELTLWANDHPWFYWNNFGSVNATITRRP